MLDSWSRDSRCTYLYDAGRSSSFNGVRQAGFSRRRLPSGAVAPRITTGRHYTGTFLSIKGSTVQQPARRRRSFFGVGLCGPITSIHQSGRWRVRASCTVGLRRAHVLAVSSSCCTSSVRHLIHFLHRSIPFHSIDIKGCRHSNTRLPLIGLRIHHSVWSKQTQNSCREPLQRRYFRANDTSVINRINGALLWLTSG